jgi:hypothetical protein
MSGPARGTRRRSAARIFEIPAALAAVSGFGLVAALLTDGAFDLLWTLAVAAPVIVAAWAAARRA